MKESLRPTSTDYLSKIPPEGILTSGELPPERWRLIAQSSLYNLEQLSSSNTSLVRELEEYYRQIDAKLQLLQEPVGLSPALAKHYLDRVASLGTEELEGRLLTTLERIRRETHSLDDLAASGAWALLLKEWAGKHLHLPMVIYPNHDPLIPRQLCKGYDASYSPNFEVIIMCYNLPSVRETWETLVTQGVLPRAISLLYHESTHRLQHSLPQRLMMNAPLISLGPVIFSYNYNSAIRLAITLAASGLVALSPKFSKNDLILGETHARLATANLPLSSHNAGGEVINTVVALYPDGPATKLKALRAYKLIQALHLLGFSERDIGRLVQKDQWSAKAETYPRCQQAVEQRFAALGIKGKEEQEIILAAIRIRHALELLVNRHQAQAIASEELQAAARW